MVYCDRRIYLAGPQSIKEIAKHFVKPNWCLREATVRIIRIHIIGINLLRYGIAGQLFKLLVLSRVVLLSRFSP